MELKEEHFSDIKNVIMQAGDSAELAAARKAAKAEAWQNEGRAGEAIADFMIDTLRYDEPR